MDKWMWRFMEKVRMDAVNLTLNDLSFIEESITGKSTVALDDLLKSNNLLSSNLEWKQKGPSQPWRPYLILEQKLPGYRKTWKIAVMGLSAEQGAFNRSLFEVRNPVNVLPVLLAQVREKNDYVILLTNLHADAAEKLIRDFPGVDLVILSNHGVSLNPPRRVGDTALVEAYDQGKFLGELALYLDEQAQVARIRNRYIELNSSVPDPPEMARMADEARQQVDSIRLRH